MPARKTAPQETRAEEGAPAWMLTYGDMMSLLLCFFVLLVSLSELKSERFMRVLESLRRAFGHDNTQAPLPVGDAAGNSDFERINYLELIRGQRMGLSESDQSGQRGPHDRVTAVNEGQRTVVGARVRFARDSADLSQAAQDGMSEMMDLLRGHPNKIEIRGHASKTPLSAGAPFSDKWELAFARARTVATFLIRRGIEPERIRIVSCGDQEPLQETYDAAERWRDRRVEVIMTEATPDQFRRGHLFDVGRQPQNGGSERG